MALRRVTIEMPSDVLVQQGVVPRVFFDHNESVEILRVYAFQPRERLLLVRVLRSGPRRTADELLAARDSLRRRYHLRDFEILRVEDGGSAYISLLRQRKDRKSTRLNSSHTVISYAVFCLKKKKRMNAN